MLSMRLRHYYFLDKWHTLEKLLGVDMNFHIASKLLVHYYPVDNSSKIHAVLVQNVTICFYIVFVTFEFTT